VLLRVTAIEAGTVPPFDAVRELMRAEATNARLATDRGIRDKVTTAHDRIEDLRGTGKTLAEVAAETGRQTLPLVGIDQNGRDRNGTEVVGVPDLADVVKALFQSDIGVDNEAVRTRDGGYVWFEITGIDAARDRPLEEVKAEVERGWITEETGRRLAAKTEELVKSLANGATLESIAASLGTSVVETTGVTRNGQSAIGPSAQASIFGVPLQRPVAAAAPTPGARLIAIATSSSVPPFSPTAPETAELARQLTQAKAEDSVSQYLAGLRQQLGASIDQRAVAIATGAASSQP
jgi:peptidyl-prolyl cis-trans isomerase D